MFGTVVKATGVKDIGNGNIRVTCESVNADENVVISFNTTEGAKESFAPQVLETDVETGEVDGAGEPVMKTEYETIYKHFRLSLESAE